ncbi:MAG: fluoride efflux transporter FluC [Leucobacter sp.]
MNGERASRSRDSSGAVSWGARLTAQVPDFGVVALGGAAGSLARYLLTLAIGSAGEFPLATFLINILGAFLLGALVEVITRRGGDGGHWRTTRLLFGTGVLGGFTTYSLLATDTAELLLAGSVGTAAAYGLGTLLLGGAASWCGILLGRALSGHRVGGGAA